MKIALPIFTLVLASTIPAIAEPTGICLHAYSPEAPAEKIECFEFERVATARDGYRFFLEGGRSVVVSKYRYRGHVPYGADLKPGHPKFEECLKLYEETARSTPSTRRFLNPKIIAMRRMAAEKSEIQQSRENLPRIEIGGTIYLAPVFKGIEDAKLVLGHKDGIAKINLEEITNDQLQSLVKIDPNASEIVVVEISKKRLWNPKYKGISNGIVTIANEKTDATFDLDSLSDEDFEKITRIDSDFGQTKKVTIAGRKLWNPEFNGLTSKSAKIKHEKGVLELGFDQLSEQDEEIIMSWSDGTWKIGKPGFHGPNSEANSYAEVIFDGGEFYVDVEITTRKGESVVVKSRKKNLKLPLKQVYKIPGLTAHDSGRLESWALEILEERLDRATPESSSEVISFREAEVLRVTNVRVKILQVLDEGVLASHFVGKLHKGTESVKITKSVSAEHPLTEKTVTRVLDTSFDEFERIENVKDDLCYIVGNTSNLTDGEIVKADSMRLLGRYQYVDLRGAKRTVRKYHVD